MADTAADCKLRGNILYRRKRFDSAISAYSDGIAICFDLMDQNPSDRSSRLLAATLLSNRAAAYLENRSYTLCLRDCHKAKSLLKGKDSAVEKLRERIEKRIEKCEATKERARKTSEKAFGLHMKGNFIKAIEMFDIAISIAERPGSLHCKSAIAMKHSRNIASLLSGRSAVKAATTRFRGALVDARSALELEPSQARKEIVDKLVKIVDKSVKHSKIDFSNTKRRSISEEDFQFLEKLSNFK
eukprot:g3539.t1